MVFSVYRIQNKINNKIYIGKTNNFLARFARHLSIAKNGKTIGKNFYSLIHKAINKYGEENFSYTLIAEFDNEKECLDAEKFWIDYYKSNVNKFGNDFGYNLTEGGDGVSGMKHSPEAKLKIKTSLSGRKLSEERRINRLEKRRKHKPPPKIFDKTLKIIWPSNDDLIKLVIENGYRGAGQILKVSDMAIRGRLKRRNLITPELTTTVNRNFSESKKKNKKGEDGRFISSK